MLYRLHWQPVSPSDNSGELVPIGGSDKASMYHSCLFASMRIYLSINVGTWMKIKKLGSPLRFQENTQIEVAGLHWLDPKQNQLIAVYKSHGAQ